MNLNETLSHILALAEEEDRLEPNDALKKQWIKSIEGIDKSVSTGYSLIGDFIAESEELNPGLYFIYQEFNRCYVTKKSFVKWETTGLLRQRKMAEDVDGNVIFEMREVEETDTVRRGILFDFSDRVSLIYCRFLPQRWAKCLWKPIENWLEQQPNIEAKIEFWEKEVALRTDALRQAQQRLGVLKRASPGLDDNLDPQTKEWLQTAAVLGTKKKRPEGDRSEA